MSRNESVPLGQITIRQWELTSHSTRYDRLQAAPSDTKLEMMWLLWVVVSSVVTVGVGIVLVGLLTDRKARQNPFNLYLVFLMVPDILFSGFCAISCALSLSQGHMWSTAACQFQSFYLVWGVTSNCWLNLWIAREIHKLLASTSAGTLRRYHVPTKTEVLRLAGGVYTYAGFIASWGLWGQDVTWWPHRTVSISGLGCYPLEYNRTSTIFYFVVYLPCLAVLPLSGVIYLCWDIYRRQLLPTEHCKRRLISLYFLRIVGIYVFMWTPYLILCFAGFGNPTLVFVGGTWGHFQGALSVLVSLTKPDVYQAVRNFVACQWARRRRTPHVGRTRRERPVGSFMFLWSTNNGVSGELDIGDTPIGGIGVTTATNSSQLPNSNDAVLDVIPGNQKHNNSDVCPQEQPAGTPETVEDFLPRQNADLTFGDEHQNGNDNARVVITEAP